MARASATRLRIVARSTAPGTSVSPIAKAGVPFWIIHGDDDQMVPLEPNSVRLKSRYEAAGRGDLVTLVVAEGQGHSMWEGFFRCQDLVDFLIDRARAGAK